MHAPPLELVILYWCSCDAMLGVLNWMTVLLPLQEQGKLSGKLVRAHGIVAVLGWFCYFLLASGFFLYPFYYAGPLKRLGSAGLTYQRQSLVMGVIFTFVAGNGPRMWIEWHIVYTAGWFEVLQGISFCTAFITGCTALAVVWIVWTVRWSKAFQVWSLRGMSPSLRSQYLAAACANEQELEDEWVDGIDVFAIPWPARSGMWAQPDFSQAPPDGSPEQASAQCAAAQEPTPPQAAAVVSPESSAPRRSVSRALSDASGARLALHTGYAVSAPSVFDELRVEQQPRTARSGGEDDPPAPAADPDAPSRAGSVEPDHRGPPPPPPQSWRQAADGCRSPSFRRAGEAPPQSPVAPLASVRQERSSGSAATTQGELSDDTATSAPAARATPVPASPPLAAARRGVRPSVQPSPYR
eukprot:TRINITY_DN3174_c2_g1_i1.p1 TRINITY_DN3174_c2_g1~~TRINITY_DN3174_c2_g1_i1.p1  ORF type:complete len:412 (+),score=89.96 TRINITY_DN3174_c2_g1_i1:61-1296(+)